VTLRDKFLALLRYSIGAADVPPGEITTDDWPMLYEMAKQQALVGVVFEGMNRMPAEQRPDKIVSRKWFAQLQRIEERNKEVNKAAIAVANDFSKRGFRTCLLKGQGNTLHYPKPYQRTSGDIDIWVEGGDTAVLKALKGKVGRAIYHHVEMPSKDGVPVEVHYRPSFLNNLADNSRLQRFFLDKADAQFSNKQQLPGTEGEIAVPTPDFNLVYEICHITHHLLKEGIGLRQLLDYYYLLQSNIPDDVRRQAVADLKRIHLDKMAAAVMYVTSEAFGLEERYFLLPPDERRGKLMLSEIMQAGNFGQYDERVHSITGITAIDNNLQRLKRDCRFLKYFPRECLSEPLFRIYHFFWRLRHR